MAKMHYVIESAKFLYNPFVQQNQQQQIKLTTTKDNVFQSTTHKISTLFSQDLKTNQIQRISQFPIHESIAISSISPSNKYLAVLQNLPSKSDKNKKNQVLEIYDNDYLIRNINLDDFHEKVLQTTITGEAFVWNEQETKIMYVCSLKNQPKPSLFEQQSDELDEEKVKSALTGHEYEADFGEKLNDIYQTGIFIYDLTTHTLEQVQLPENVFPCYPTFTNPSGTDIIFSGFKYSKELKLGLIYCLNREYTIYHLVQNQYKTKVVFPKPKEKKEEKENQELQLEEQKEQEKQKKEQEQKKKEKEKEEIANSLKNVLSDEETSIRPILSPDFSKILYFGSKLLKEHANCLKIKTIDIATKKNNDVVPIYETMNKELQFAGFNGNYDIINATFWLSDSKHVVFASDFKNCQNVYILNVETQQIQKLLSNDLKCSYTYKICDVNKSNNNILISFKASNQLEKLLLLTGINLQSNSDLKEVIKNIQVQEIQIVANKCQLQLNVEKVMSQLVEETVKIGEVEGYLYKIDNYGKFSEDYFKIFEDELNLLTAKENEHLNFNREIEAKKFLEDQNKPLLLILHGGPHVSLAAYSFDRLLYLLNGFNVFIPAFTGTTGFGSKFASDLMGKIGELDINEIVSMLKIIIQNKKCDPTKIISFGASYGGYLTAWITQKFSELFQAGILWNPVTNLPFNLLGSDIPDWQIAEGLSQHYKVNLSPEEYATMFQKSPMSNHNFKIPLLMLLGKKDRRVHYQQGVAYSIQALKNGAEVQTYLYPESDHGLMDSVNTVYDVKMKILHFLHNHFFKN